MEIIAEKSIELGKKGAEEVKKIAIWASSIEAVRRSLGGAIVGSLVFGLVGSMLPGHFVFTLAKLGFIIGLVTGYMRK